MWEDSPKYEIKEEIAVLSENTKTGWQKELNLVSWNGQPAKYDIRDWADNHTKMGKGCSLSDAELSALYKALDTHLDVALTRAYSERK